MINIYKDILFGVGVADSVGVPVEFYSRESLKLNPVVGMREYGTHHQPSGTWSDDTSLTLCLADTLLVHGYDIRKIARSFYDWLNDNLWTPHGFVFDIGITTQTAINKYSSCVTIDDYLKAGGNQINDNGNGALMRILPILIYIKDLPITDRFQIIKDVSSLTHGNAVSVISCFYYLEFARLILNDETNKFIIYNSLKTIFEEPFIQDLLTEDRINNNTFDKFNGNEILYTLPEDDIKSGGYVLHSLEASIWCLLNTENYEQAVLRAVNLGGDTDTTAAITGGLAGLIYGFETIPSEWMDVIARKDDIEILGNKLKDKYDS